MRTHTFYFVRHGESILNSQGIRQGREGGLSEKGKKQADVAALLLKDKKIQAVLVSPYERTLETAAIIMRKLRPRIPVELNELLRERKNPSEIIGRSGEGPEVARIIDLMDKSYHLDNFRFSDEENFEDLKGRAKECLAFLESRKEKRVAVVTHGIFLKMLISYMIYRDDLTASGYNKLSFFNESNNAGVSVCTYTDGLFAPRRDKRWKLIEWDLHLIEKAPIGILPRR